MTEGVDLSLVTHLSHIKGLDIPPILAIAFAEPLRAAGTLRKVGVFTGC